MGYSPSGSPKVLFVIAKKDFRDPEYFIPAEILKNSGFQIFKASNLSSGEYALGAEGGRVEIDYDIKEVDPNLFSLIVFVGGPGALENLDNEVSYSLIRSFLKNGKKDKYLAAICIAPVILAKAGVLKGVKATVWSSKSDKKPIEILKEKGAIYQSSPLVFDGNIITANGPRSAEKFGKICRQVLLKKL